MKNTKSKPDNFKNFQKGTLFSGPKRGGTNTHQNTSQNLKQKNRKPQKMRIQKNLQNQRDFWKHPQQNRRHKSNFVNRDNQQDNFRIPKKPAVTFPTFESNTQIIQDFSVEKTKIEARLKKLLSNYNGLITFNPQTRFWLTGFFATEGMGLARLNAEKEIEFHLFLDQRYFAAALRNISRTGIKLYNERDEFIEFLQSCNYKTLLVESDYMKVSEAKMVRNFVGKECVLYDMQGNNLRIIKSQEEAANILKASEISLDALKWLRINVLFPGITEAQAARALIQRMYHLGASEIAFDPIVAFGPNSANPHHSSGETKLKAGDIVLVDFGAKVGRYCTDITRTFLAPGNSELTVQQQEILRKTWNLVDQAAKKCRAESKVDTAVSTLEELAYKQIEEAKMEKYWKHSLGHGVGLDIHESPRVTKTSDETLKNGYVITIEPGLYLNNLGGARIEDTLLITKQGPKILSRPYLYAKTTYQKEFDYYDLSTLVKDIKANKIEAPNPNIPENKDLILLLKIYEEALKTNVIQDQMAQFKTSRLNQEDVLTPKKELLEPVFLDNIVDTNPKHSAKLEENATKRIIRSPLKAKEFQQFESPESQTQISDNPLPLVKKGRGRPRKTESNAQMQSLLTAEGSVRTLKRDGRKTAQESENQKVLEVDGSNTSTKRRGRPPKNAQNQITKTTLTNLNNNQESFKKSRGRPRKVTK